MFTWKNLSYLDLKSKNRVSLLIAHLQEKGQTWRMEAQQYSGGCACGAVRFTATGTPKFVAICHCKDCRTHTGAVFSTFVGFFDEQVNWHKAPRSLRESSFGVKRGFCSKCGTPLSYQGKNWAGETHLYLGTFDDPESLPIQGLPGEVFENEKISWVKI
jgi:hypothetical protein